MRHSNALDVLRAEAVETLRRSRVKALEQLEFGLARVGYCLHGHKDMDGRFYCEICGEEVFLRPDFRLDAGGVKEVLGILGSGVLFYSLSLLAENPLLVMGFEFFGAIMIYTGLTMFWSSSWAMIVTGGGGILWSLAISEFDRFIVLIIYIFVFLVGFPWRILRLSKMEMRRKTEQYFRFIDWLLSLLE